MIVFVLLKMYFRKLPPRVISYRNFSNYDNATLINSLNEVLYENENRDSFLKHPAYFYRVFTEVLNKYGPPKKKYIRRNNKPFMNKEISKAIMLRVKLRNKLLKYLTSTNRISHSKQRNFCLSLLQKEKKKYFGNPIVKNIRDNKIFWKTLKPFLSEKTKSRKKLL